MYVKHLAILLFILYICAWCMFCMYVNFVCSSHLHVYVLGREAHCAYMLNKLWTFVLEFEEYLSLIKA